MIGAKGYLEFFDVETGDLVYINYSSIEVVEACSETQSYLLVLTRMYLVEGAAKDIIGRIAEVEGKLSGNDVVISPRPTDD